jgi:nucleoside-diphosphate-sugar epimerase
MNIAITHTKDLIGSALYDGLLLSSHDVTESATSPGGAELAVFVPSVFPGAGKAALSALAQQAKTYAAACSDKQKLVLVLSSMAVYGDRGGVEDRQRIDENTPVPPPPTGYAAALAEVEKAFREAAVTRRVPVCILRVGIAYSDVDSDGSKNDGPFKTLVLDPMKEREFKTPGGGVNNIATIHADDIVSAVKLIAMDPEKAVGKTYPLADGHDITLADLVGKVARTLKIARPEDNTGFFMSWGLFVSDGDKVLKHQQKCDPSALKRDFEWEPRGQTAVESL